MRHVQGIPNPFRIAGFSRLPPPCTPVISFSAVSPVCRIFPHPLFLFRIHIHTYTRAQHALSFSLPLSRSLSQFSSSPLFHRLFGLIRHFHRPTPFPAVPSLAQLALNTRFLIDFSPSRVDRARSRRPHFQSRRFGSNASMS